MISQRRKKISLKLRQFYGSLTPGGGGPWWATAFASSFRWSGSSSLFRCNMIYHVHVCVYDACVKIITMIYCAAVRLWRCADKNIRPSGCNNPSPVIIYIHTLGERYTQVHIYILLLLCTYTRYRRNPINRFCFGLLRVSAAMARDVKSLRSALHSLRIYILVHDIYVLCSRFPHVFSSRPKRRQHVGVPFPVRSGLFGKNVCMYIYIYSPVHARTLAHTHTHTHTSHMLFFSFGNYTAD